MRSPSVIAFAAGARRAALPLAVLAVPAALAAFSAPAAAQTLTPPDTTQGCRWMPECSAPGASLRMLEVARSGSGRGTKVTVSPRVSGLPVGEPLTLWMRRTGGEPQWVVTGYALDAAGAVVCADRERHAALAGTAGTGWCPVALDSIALGVGDAMTGEAFAFAVATADGRRSAYAVVVPRPATASAPGCGTLKAQLMDGDAKSVAIVGRGFAPSAEVTTESRSGKETLPGSVVADSTGRFVAIVMPGTRGGRGGDAAFTARAAGCEVTLSYPWGRAAR
jgi:hypothetical protein